MRELVFRGKRTDTGAWVYGSYVHYAKRGVAEHCILSEGKQMLSIIPETVGQYTGLDDINRAMIFEGDIVEFSEVFHKNKRIRAEVFFSNYYYGFYVKQQDGKNGISICEDIEVIGNIHDKPELVPQRKEQPAAGVNICDRCGRVMNNDWEIPGMPGVGGNCTYCGDDLCAECAGTWNEHGECERCAVPY